MVGGEVRGEKGGGGVRDGGGEVVRQEEGMGEWWRRGTKCAGGREGICGSSGGGATLKEGGERVGGEGGGSDMGEGEGRSRGVEVGKDGVKGTRRT